MDKKKKRTQELIAHNNILSFKSNKKLRQITAGQVKSTLFK